jgi:uncharacterized membrane protein
VTAYTFVVFVHVVAAVVLVGGGILATPTVHRAIGRASTISDLRRWLTIGRPLGRINPLSSLVLLASGIYLASMGEWWGAEWVHVAVGLWLVNATLAIAAVKPAMAQLAIGTASAHSEEIPVDLDRLRSSPKLLVTSDVMLANDLGVLLLMVTKPSGYLVPLIVLVIAQIALFGLRALASTSPTRLPEPVSPYRDR